MEIGTIVYLTEPCKWRKTPDGDWNEYEYPIGTPLKVIGDSGMRGPDLEFLENGIQMHECRFVKFSTENPLLKEITKLDQKYLEMIADTADNLNFLDKLMKDLKESSEKSVNDLEIIFNDYITKEKQAMNYSKENCNDDSLLYLKLCRAYIQGWNDYKKFYQK